jgi:hypothetical protein
VDVKSQTQREYTVAICKGSAKIGETRILLKHWRPEEPVGDFARRVQEEGLLGNATAHRTRDLVTCVFGPRFLKPSDSPARILRSIVQSRLPGNVFTELLFVFAARHDPLVYDFTVHVYWPAAKRRRATLDNKDVLSFIREAQLEGRLHSQWSDEVSGRVARGVLGFLRDIGFLRKVSPGRSEMANYRMSDEGAAILAWELHQQGATDSALCNHPDWGLFGLTASDVLGRLDGLGEHRGIIVQRAGSVVHLTWLAKSIEELIDVLTR